MAAHTWGLGKVSQCGKWGLFKGSPQWQSWWNSSREFPTSSMRSWAQTNAGLYYRAVPARSWLPVWARTLEMNSWVRTAGAVKDSSKVRQQVGFEFCRFYLVSVLHEWTSQDQPRGLEWWLRKGSSADWVGWHCPGCTVGTLCFSRSSGLRRQR